MFSRVRQSFSISRSSAGTLNQYLLSSCLFGILVFGLVFSQQSRAGSLFLPLKLSPEIESRVEKLFVIANIPIIKRPISMKQVEMALEKVGSSEPELVAEIEEYLRRFSFRFNVTHFQVSGSYHTGANEFEANRRGIDRGSSYDASIAGYWTFNDFVALNFGGIVSDTNGLKDEFPDGTFLSLGWDFLQFDIGNRPHWFGPFQESDMLISTHAPSITSVTVSNVVPLDFLGTTYEVFIGEMSESDEILSQNRDERLVGNPRLFGVHLGFAPIEGFAIGFNRLMQFGGADRDESPSSLAQAFFDAKSFDNVSNGGDFGNQLTSVTTRYTFSGEFPISVYMEYGGEDTSGPSDAHLGNSALMLGVHLPKVFERFDATYEYAEWQNAWYVNTNYGDGLTHFGRILGHWGGSRRVDGDAVGAESQTAKLIWYIQPGRQLTSIYRQQDNIDIGTSIDYETAQEWSLEYAQAWESWIVGLTLITGNDVFGEDYTKVSGFLRW